MTWNNVFDIISIKSMSPEEKEFILWNETCFPFGTAKRIVKQINQYLRAKKNNLDCCHLCGRKKPFHVKGCMEKEFERSIK